MGRVPVEKSFPRGQIQDSQEDANNSKSSNKKKSLKAEEDDAPNWGKYRKDKVKRKSNTGSVYAVRQYVGKLTYKLITEGMLVLGAINKIEEFRLWVTLPGDMVGIVAITNISEAYTASLQGIVSETFNDNVYQLRDMFKVGQNIVTKVVGNIFDRGSHKVTLTLCPSHVYSGYTHRDLVKGMVITAAVQSVEDNGYIMDLGIKSTRAFLPKVDSLKYEQRWMGGNPLGIGQLVRCFVNISTIDQSITTVVVTADPQKVSKATSDNTGATFDTLVPGMQFTAIVSHKYPTGIQIRLSDNVVGYIHQDHFSSQYKTSRDIENGITITVKVLYILQSGVAYFTMKSGIFGATVSLPFEKVKRGEIVEKAIVESVGTVGLAVQLVKAHQDQLKGFIPFSHMNRKAEPGVETFDMPLSEQLALSYPAGMSVTCRVMDYNFIDQYYICTMDAALMEERYLHEDMLDVGQVVTCFVKSVQPKGIVLSLGSKITGFVPLIHISDVPLTHPEKKFQAGQACQARVLSMKDGNLFLTMKSSFVKSTVPILTSLDHLTVGEKYNGTVLQVTVRGLLVQFYNQITGWIPPHYLSVERLRGEEIIKNFYVGQVVKCNIRNKTNTIPPKLELSLIDKSLFVENEDCQEGSSQSKADLRVENGNAYKKRKTEKVVTNDVKTIEERMLNKSASNKKRKAVGLTDSSTTMASKKMKNSGLKRTVSSKKVLKKKKKKVVA